MYETSKQLSGNGSIVEELLIDSKPGMKFLKHKVMSPFSLNPAIAVALISSKGPYIKPMEKNSLAFSECWSQTTNL